MGHSIRHGFTRLLALGAALCLASACGAGSGAPGAPSDGNGGAAKPAPSATVTCSDVCANVATCGVASARCTAVCPQLSLPCQGCLARTACAAVDATCTAICGTFARPKKPPAPLPGKQCDVLTFDFTSASVNHQTAGDGSAPCTTPFDCRSQTCVMGTIGQLGQTMRSVAFCAQEGGNCASDAECEDGWKCAQVPEDRSTNPTVQSICVPPDMTPCAPGELQWR